MSDEPSTVSGFPFEPVYGPDGSVVDVRVSYPLDLQAQMLAYSSIS